MVIRSSKPADAKPTKPAAKAKPATKADLSEKARPEIVFTSADKPMGKPSKAVAAGSKAEAFKLKDLIAAVAAGTGGKRPDVKLAVEATLLALAEALTRGADLMLPPLGRVRVVKAASKGGAAVMTLKLRLGGAGKPASKQPLAEDGEDS